MPSRLAQLARPAPAPVREDAPAPAEEEHCDLCGEPVPPTHRHLVDTESRRLLCACRACTLLFDRAAAGGGHLKLVPLRRRRLEDFQLDAAAWERLRIPVEMAFFFDSSAAGRTIALYPSPMGATESQLTLDGWSALVEANPVLGQLEPDVEALLVSHARDAHEHWIVPVDDCYELVGLVRSHWRGFGGGQEVWDEIARFFDDLSTREDRRW